MKEDKTNELKELYRQAADIASVVPESMQEAAFNKAVEHLSGHINIKTNFESNGVIQAPTQEHSLKPMVSHIIKDSQNWHNDFNSIGHPEVSEANTVLDKSLHILAIAREDHKIDKLSPADIATVLSEKYRIPAKASQISDKLGKVAGKLVERLKIGKGYEYKIMLPGEQYLERQHTTKIVRKSKTTKKKYKVNSPSETTKSRRTNNGRPGQKDVLLELIDNGFFNTPKTISDIITHIVKTKGYTYKTNELTTPLVRLMRDGRLKRDEQENGKWEYSKV